MHIMIDQEKMLPSSVLTCSRVKTFNSLYTDSFRCQSDIFSQGDSSNILHVDHSAGESNLPAGVRRALYILASTFHGRRLVLLLQIEEQ